MKTKLRIKTFKLDKEANTASIDLDIFGDISNYDTLFSDFQTFVAEYNKKQLNENFGIVFIDVINFIRKK